ncbi:MAG TPA: Mth938-like domain-containing protein [Xanthomonadales bacterium]|nr:Mth938-like domain-containing protein [Xanthomonadales bacterium]
MDLTLQRPGDHLYIRAVSGQGIQIGEHWYLTSLILSADRLIPDWSLDRVENYHAALLEPIFNLGPDVVLLGTGTSQHFLPPEFMMEFYQRGVGVEVMSTDAACRTFNVLVSEGRRVVAALMQSRANPSP